jgi:4'-phosphopantetheinyl transferase
MQNTLTPGPNFALSPDRVDMWFLFENQVTTAPELLASYRDVLTQQERLRAERFLFARDRDRYLLTRGLVRTVLSRYIPIDASDWRFEPNAYGRPMITNNHDWVSVLSFNISHTDGLIVLAVASDRAVGVDTERTERKVDVEAADHYFSPNEVAALQRLPKQLQPRRFLDLWTLKESYIKARGMGLSIPLDKFSFELDRRQHSLINFDADLDDLPDRWRFYHLFPSKEHLVALCLQHKTSAMPAVICRQIIPLVSERIFECPVSTLSDQ